MKEIAGLSYYTKKLTDSYHTKKIDGLSCHTKKTAGLSYHTKEIAGLSYHT